MASKKKHSSKKLNANPPQTQKKLTTTHPPKKPKPSTKGTPAPSPKKSSRSTVRSQTNKTKVSSARMTKSTSEIPQNDSLLEQPSPKKRSHAKAPPPDTAATHPAPKKEAKNKMTPLKKEAPSSPAKNASKEPSPETPRKEQPTEKQKEEHPPEQEKRKKNPPPAAAPLEKKKSPEKKPTEKKPAEPKSEKKPPKPKSEKKKPTEKKPTEKKPTEPKSEEPKPEKKKPSEKKTENPPKKMEKTAPLSEKSSPSKEPKRKEPKKKKKLAEGESSRASKTETKKSKKTSFTAFTNSNYNSSEPLYRKPKRPITDFKSFPTEELFKAYQKRIQEHLQEERKKQAILEEALDPKTPILKKNETVPNFLLSDLSLGIHNLKELQSKKVVLFHWSSWDRKCRESLLIWYKFWIQRKGEFTFVTIAQDQNPLMVQAFRDYYQLYGQECYFLIDRDASIEDHFPLYDLPKVHLVNEFGIICGMLADPIQPLDYLESFLRTRPLEDLPKSIANIPTIRDMKRKMEEAQEETIENKFDLAHGYFLNGKGKVSAAILEEIIELQPDNPKAHFRRGVILWELGMQDKAMEHLVFAREIAKNNELYKKRIQVLEKPELFYSKEQINYKPPSVSSGSE